ncbi:MAG: hypothetical protein IKT40_06000 [Bacilli bacterium]|nr:hypothetical protein [Bacilli bacterium]
MSIIGCLITVLISIIIPLTIVYFENMIQYFYKIKYSIQDKINGKRLDEYIERNCKNIISYAQNIETLLLRYIKAYNIGIDKGSTLSEKDIRAYSRFEVFFNDLSRDFRFQNEKHFHRIVTYNVMVDEIDKIIGDILESYDKERHIIIERICTINRLPYEKGRTTLKNTLDLLFKKVKIEEHSMKNDILHGYSILYFTFLCNYNRIYYFPWYSSNCPLNEIYDKYEYILTYIFRKYCPLFTKEKYFIDSKLIKKIYKK